MAYEVIWSDEDLIAINKPPGLRSIRDGYHAELPHLDELLTVQFGRVWVIHRLDKDTSGVIIFARNPEMHRALNQQFEQRETRKVYHALVVGMPEWQELSIALPLRINGDRKHRTVIDHQTGKAASTDTQVLQRLGVFTLLSALPHTGYTHQIRAHLAAVGFPLLADSLYKSLKPETQAQVEAKKIAASLPIQRPALHASSLEIKHPRTGRPLIFQAPYAEDFESTLQALDKIHRAVEG